MLQGSGQHNQTSRSHLSDAENEEVEVFFKHYRVYSYFISLVMIYIYNLIFFSFRNFSILQIIAVDLAPVLALIHLLNYK